MNTFLNELKKLNNFTTTENGAITHKTTLSELLDLFSFGGAYRDRTNEECVKLFREAYQEDPILALKCLFYLRDCRSSGQGERRFFRVCYHWLAIVYPIAALRHMQFIPEYGRWDDLFCLFDTPIEIKMLKFIKTQIGKDIESEYPSLLAKWMPSINTSSEETRTLAKRFRDYFHMTDKEYRKMLASLREKIKVLEKLMSSNRWDEINFDKIPSKAGLIYKNAFARRDILNKKYEAFAKSDAKVNAEVLYPHEVAKLALRCKSLDPQSTDRLIIQKYWDNLPDFYEGREENGLAIVDVSGSMNGLPIEAAISLGAYIADKAHGPFANHFITFSKKPKLVKFKGSDITDKFRGCINTEWGLNTDIEAVFDLLLSAAKERLVKLEDMPDRLYILSDMEFDKGLHSNLESIKTLIETKAQEWKHFGYKIPQIVFWNLRSSRNNIPAIGEGFTYVSGFSPSILKTILCGKNGYDLMLEILNSDRYKVIGA